MIKHPSIEQFRNVVKNVIGNCKYHNTPIPTLRFYGSVKVHGTNSSIVLHPNGDYDIQTRNRKINLNKENDNHFGFVDFVKDNIDKIKESVYPRHSEHPVIVYGEWFGEAIQKGVAVSELSKRFMIFGIFVGNNEDDGYWISHDNIESFCDVDKLNEIDTYISKQFDTFYVDIDFNNPQLSQNVLKEITEGVENECPVGKYFGVSGTGEGIVWKCVTEGFEHSRYWFKVKGEKHSVSKVKTLAEVDVEKLKTVNEFVDKTVTENRMLQGIEYLNEMDKPIDRSSTGDFLSWVFADIMKEENDLLKKSGLNRKDIGKDIGTKARTWFFEYIDNDLGL